MTTTMMLKASSTNAGTVKEELLDAVTAGAVAPASTPVAEVQLHQFSITAISQSDLSPGTDALVDN
jgi:hypothetical protein